jgi:hypothetical protein
MRPEFFADPVDKELYPSAPRTAVNIKPFLVDEQLAEFAEYSPTRAFVEGLSPHIIERPVTAGTGHRISFLNVAHRRALVAKRFIGQQNPTISWGFDRTSPVIVHFAAVWFTVRWWSVSGDV